MSDAGQCITVEDMDRIQLSDSLEKLGKSPRGKAALVALEQQLQLEADLEAATGLNTVELQTLLGVHEAGAVIRHKRLQFVNAESVKQTQADTSLKRAEIQRKLAGIDAESARNTKKAG